MKITRHNIFETNSSSSHSLTLNKLVNQMDNYEKTVCLHYDNLNLNHVFLKEQLEKQNIFYGQIREFDSEFIAHNFAQKIDYLVTFLAILVQKDVFTKYTTIKNKINEEKSKTKMNIDFTPSIPLIDLGNVYQYALLSKKTIFNNQTYKGLFIQEIYNHPLFKNLFEVFYELTGKKLYIDFYFGDHLKEDEDYIEENENKNLKYSSSFLKNLTSFNESSQDFYSDFDEIESFGFSDENRNSNLIYSLLYSKDLLKIVLCSSENYLKYS